MPFSWRLTARCVTRTSWGSSVRIPTPEASPPIMSALDHGSHCLLHFADNARMHVLWPPRHPPTPDCSINFSEAQEPTRAGIHTSLMLHFFGCSLVSCEFESFPARSALCLLLWFRCQWSKYSYHHRRLFLSPCSTSWTKPCARSIILRLRHQIYPANLKTAC